MKEKRVDGSNKQVDESQTKRGGVIKGLLIKKNSPEGVLLNRIRRSLLSSNLNPSSPIFQPQQEEGTSCQNRPEVEVGKSTSWKEVGKSRGWKEPTRLEEDKDQDKIREQFIKEEQKQQQQEEDDGLKSDDVEEEEEEFVPSIKIKRMEENILISIMVLKHVSLSSSLFRILEEEKADVLYENQYRTETKVSYTILVNLPKEEQYVVDGLKEKLCKWALAGKDESSSLG